MKNSITFLSGQYLILMLVFLTGCNSQVTNLPIANKGEAKAIIVLPENPTELQKIAVADFVKTIKKATGATIPIVNGKAGVKNLSSKTIRIILGPSDFTNELGFDAQNLEPESYAIYHKNNDIIILAEDRIPEDTPGNIWLNSESENSRVTQWAFGYLLDHFVGVRWLWPGELGTYVPKTETLTFPVIDTIIQQKLVRRTFNPIETNPENLLWLSYHQFSGQREPYRFRHSFREIGDNGDWWKEFNETNPEYFAKNPQGKINLYNGKDEFYKLCISTPAVADEIVRRWKKAGSPDFWDITTNDGNGFCTCNNCMDLDEKYGGKRYSKEEVWDRKNDLSLTGRYVWFWNKMVTKMRETNPNAKVGVFLYSGYRNPPEKLKLEPGIVGEIVHSFDFNQWIKWREAGISEIGLRPNWLYMGASAPHLPLSTVGSYLENARKNEMVLIDMDCFHEYWATQGPYYYLLGRMVARPDLNTDDIIKEYASAFEDASSKIKEYLNFWEEFHEPIGYNIPAGGSIWPKEDGLYEQLSLKHFGERMHPLRGHWKILPYIYTPEHLNKALTILSEAEEAANSDEVKNRIEFLRDGLVMLEKNIDYIKALNAKDETEQLKAVEELYKFQNEMTKKHGYWNSKDIFFLKYWGLIGKEMDTRGM